MANIKTMGKASTTPKASKVISTGTLTPVRGGNGKMAGKQTVKAAKSL